MAETRRRKHIRTTEIPQEVIFYHILPRLPAKSLIHFLSVSKQWHSFLKSPMFANMHLNHVTNDAHQNHYKLLVIYITPRCSFSNMDCETLKLGLSHRRHLPFELSYGQDIQIKSSCNGLVMVVLLKKGSLDDRFLDLILWNPLTGDYKTLSKSGSNLDCQYNAPFELYYNSSEEDYRLLHITSHNDVHIYSLKSDSWRKINSKCEFECIPNMTRWGWSASTCWNGNLYFTKLVSTYYLTIRFDTKTEKFTEIKTPLRQNNNWCSRLTVQRGCLHMCVREYSHMERNPQLMLWSMNANGVWNKVSSTYTPENIDPLHLMKDGNWLVKSKSYCYKIYKLDLENKHSESGYLYNLRGCVEEKYIETFVSPNQYIYELKST